MIRAGTFPSIFGSTDGHFSWPSFRRSVWLAPAAFAIHAAEDAPGLAEWMRRTQLFEPVSRGQLVVALFLLVALSGLCAYAARKGVRWALYAVAWMQAFIFLHGIAHVVASAWFLEYVPGLVTGVLLLPISYSGYRHSRTYGHFGRKTACVLLISAVLLYDPVLRLAFWAAGVVTIKQPEHSPPEAAPTTVASAVMGGVEFAEEGS